MAKRRRRGGCLGLLAVVVLVGAALWFVHSWGGPGPAKHKVTITVAPGTSLASTAAQLQKAGAISSATEFRLLARIFGKGDGIKAGEYSIPAHLSQADILRLLQGGKTLQRLVVVPEGLPSVLVQEKLMGTSELTGQVPVPAEGSILPDSYAYDRDEPRQAVLDRMQRAMDKYLAAAWAQRSSDTVAKTPREALILASIVEKETGKPSERPMVAAVYSNRLRHNMMLQADPTIIYPITKGKPLGRRIKESEVHAVNAYNTYAMTGLPAGPIANPGRASIDAVLHPAKSDALYFVADGTGGHAFADTLEQHNANVQKWYAIRRARGEM